jgi:rod shape-determining protein MreC
VSRRANDLAGELREIQDLRDRVAELEELVAQYQTELVVLREVNSDYNRFAALLEYTNTFTEREFVTADVIFYDPTSRIRAIVINRGARDGIARGMPVVTDQGLVGRVTSVAADASRVLLVNDSSSYVSARLQTTREEGSVQGLPAGGLRMIDIPLDANAQVGDVVLTSGLGGNFPPDLLIGTVSSVRQFEFERSQEAEVRSLIDFDSLEFVLVITSFEPVDLSVFEDEDTAN